MKSRNEVWGPRDQKDPTSREYATETVRALKQYLEAADIDEARVCEELARIDRYRHWTVLGHKSKAEMLEAEGLAERFLLDIVNEELSQLAADQAENLKDQLAIWQASERSQTPSCIRLNESRAAGFDL